MLFESIVYSLILSLSFADIDEPLLFCPTAPPKLSNGLIKRDRVSFYKGQGFLGNMEYTCLPGFVLLGDKTITCLNGVWTSMPQCIPKRRCPPIESYPLNTVIVSDNTTIFQNDPQQIVVGSTVTLSCMENYEFDPNSHGSMIVQCQNDGSWTPMPICRYAQTTCDYSRLYLPAHSQIIRMNFKFSDTDRQLHRVGSNLEYSCEDGYRLDDGKSSLIVECLSSGSWSDLPVCEFVYEKEPSVRCNYPIYIKNGFITLYNVTIWEDQSYTGRIVYECNYGYETVEGKDQIESECINGTWTYVADCQEIPTCPKQDLLDIEAQVENSYVHNVSLQYIRDPSAFVCDSYVLRVCLPNFEHDPSSPPLKIQCERYTNTWTGIPVCQAIKTTTTTPMISMESRMESDNLVLPTTPIFSTESEEIPKEHDDLSIGSTSIEHQFPTITSMTSTENDNLSLPTSLNENQFQTTITTMEIESSTLVFDTTHTIVCDPNEIPLIPHAIISQLELNGTYDVGTILTFICQLGYESLYNQTSFTQCSMNGTWTMDRIHRTMCQEKKNFIVESETTEESNITEYLNEIFTESPPAIAAGGREVRQTTSYCKHFPQIPNAQLLVDDTIKHNSSDKTIYTGSALFVCPYGFISDNTGNEPFRLTCQEGDFHPKVTCTEKPRCSLPPPIDSSRSSVVNSLINVFDTSTDEAIPGSFITLNCIDKTNNEISVFNMTCLENGQWLLPPPPCVAPFKRRCQSGITIPNARTQIHAKLTVDGYFDDGSRANYRCLEHFVHDQQSGPLHIQCRNGRWGPRPRCIPTGCLEPLPDTIENGWKSAESYIVQSDTKYYLLTRYSCHANALMMDSSSRVLDIECRNGQWQHKALPVCQLQE